MYDRYDPDARFFQDWERMQDEYLLQREHEEEEKRERLLRGEAFFGDPDLYRDIRRGK